MKYLKKIVVILMVALFASSCVEPELKYSPLFFGKRTDYGFYIEARAIYSFNTTSDQLYFNKATNTFKILSDDGENFAEVVLTAPIERVGQMIMASVKNNGLKGEIPNNDSIEFEVINIEKNTCWLWHQKTGLGVVAFFVK